MSDPVTPPVAPESPASAAHPAPVTASPPASAAPARATTEAAQPEVARALLESANSASQSVAVLHFTFMAVCAYLLLVVLGTTDLHLLVGRNVRLPVVDMEVPIVAFYALSPWLLVLMHFNLLIQLQLLSRKLYAFDAAAGPRHRDPGGLRDRLHVFPYSYMLAGDMTPLMRNLTAHVVAITVLVLPAVALFAMLIRFLGYQSPVVTTAQRTALWLDVLLVIALWPVIMDRGDRWTGWWRELFSKLRLGVMGWIAWGLLVAGLALVLFGGDYRCLRAGAITVAVALGLALLRPLGSAGFAGLCARLLPTLLWLGITAALLRFTPVFGGWASQLPALVFAAAIGALLLAPWIFFWRADLPCGGVVLAGIVTLQLLLPQAIVTEGELMASWPGWLARHLWHPPVLQTLAPGGLASPNCPRAREFEVEQARRYRDPERYDPDRARAAWCQRQGWSVLSCDVLEGARRIDLREQPVFAQAPDPLALAELRRDQWKDAAAWDAAQDRVQRASLRDRSLRHARLEGAVLVRADLRQTDLTGACLTGARLGGAELAGALLRGAVLWGASLRGASLGGDVGTDRPAGKTDFGYAVLNWAVIARATLDDADVAGARIVDLVSDVPPAALKAD
ncbi:pentapeptide repeat-containing protein [Derxia gummosa]|uniref:Pentapeptide repeat-containing protein n=1 Tax=Derxia gummosa DSM 723 TaxID=1121388 RepID=A0A8B6X5A7_9BURK|nr:pentapeptide repeat-containing protein [Derxia gummosa]